MKVVESGPSPTSKLSPVKPLSGASSEAVAPPLSRLYCTDPSWVISRYAVFACHSPTYADFSFGTGFAQPASRANSASTTSDFATFMTPTPSSCGCGRMLRLRALVCETLPALPRRAGVGAQSADARTKRGVLVLL